MRVNPSSCAGALFDCASHSLSRTHRTLNRPPAFNAARRPRFPPIKRRRGGGAGAATLRAYHSFLSRFSRHDVRVFYRKTLCAAHLCVCVCGGGAISSKYNSQIALYALYLSKSTTHKGAAELHYHHQSSDERHFVCVCLAALFLLLSSCISHDDDMWRERKQTYAIVRLHIMRRRNVKCMRAPLAITQVEASTHTHCTY